MAFRSQTRGGGSAAAEMSEVIAVLMSATLRRYGTLSAEAHIHRRQRRELKGANKAIETWQAKAGAGRQGWRAHWHVTSCV